MGLAVLSRLFLCITYSTSLFSGLILTVHISYTQFLTKINHISFSFSNPQTDKIYTQRPAECKLFITTSATLHVSEQSLTHCAQLFTVSALFFTDSVHSTTNSLSQLTPIFTAVPLFTSWLARLSSALT